MIILTAQLTPSNFPLQNRTSGNRSRQGRARGCAVCAGVGLPRVEVGVRKHAGEGGGGRGLAVDCGPSGPAVWDERHRIWALEHKGVGPCAGQVEHPARVSAAY